MSKPTSDHLFRLIKSLTKAEKRYFKLFASRHTIGEKNDTLILFEAIDTQEVYDEKKLMKFFKQPTFQNRPAIAKARLYETVLLSLDAFHADSSVDVEVRKLLHFSEILFKKSLYDESQKMLAKAKRLATQFEKHPLLLDIFKWEKKLIESKSYFDKSFEDMTKMLEEDQVVIEKITNYCEFWYIKSRLFILLNKQGRVRDHAELASFKNIIDNTLLKGEDKALSYETRCLYYHIYSAYYFGTGDYKSSYSYIKKHLKITESNSTFFKEEPNRYFATLSNMIYLCIQIRKFKEIPGYLKKLKAIPQSFADEMTEDLEIKLFSTSLSAELSLFMKTGMFEKALQLIPAIESGIKKYSGKLNKVRVTYFYFNIAILYFADGNYSKALFWTNCLLNDTSLDESLDMYCFAKIFNLIVHLEMGNNDVIPYTFKSTLRYLEKRKRIYRFESVFFNFINKIQKAKNNEDVENSYAALRNELKVLSKDPFEKTVFEYFDFVSWAESKIRKTSFATEVKKKLTEKTLMGEVLN
jgi:tetratricopeptide (TPR) repeat protein